jgi:hypothetical protein
VVHHGAISPRDLRRRNCLTLTSPPRTILDLAVELDLETLECVVAEARYRGLAREGELKAQLERYPPRPGVSNLRAVLDLPGGPQRTRSRPERLMLRLLRHAGITGYR